MTREGALRFFYADDHDSIGPKSRRYYKKELRKLRRRKAKEEIRKWLRK